MCSAANELGVCSAANELGCALLPMSWGCALLPMSWGVLLLPMRCYRVPKPWAFITGLMIRERKTETKTGGQRVTGTKTFCICCSRVDHMPRLSSATGQVLIVPVNYWSTQRLKFAVLYSDLFL